MATTASHRPRRPPTRRSRRGRPCSICREPAGPWGAIPVGEAWVCAACFRREAGPNNPPAGVCDAASGNLVAPLSAVESTEQEQSQVLAHIHRVDRARQAISFALRTAAYTGLALWSAHSATGAALFSGFLLADTLTWLGSTVLDIRFHRIALGAELALYVIAASVWLSMDRTWTLPDDPSLQACTWLMFALVAFVKLGWTIQRYVVSDP